MVGLEGESKNWKRRGKTIICLEKLTANELLDLVSNISRYKISQ
jgi:hypothetical protein